MKTVKLAYQDIFKGNLIVVNEKYPYRENNVEADLEQINIADTYILLKRPVATLLTKILDEISGWQSVFAVSGWRSFREQKKIYDQSLKDNGVPFTRKFVALPGHSEHQTGLAVDLGLRMDTIDFIRPAFPYAGICQSFREKAVQYGFIERYPKNKELITGIAHEPWHFRYVGIPHAEIMTKQNLCLEEYAEFIKEYPYGERACHYNAGRQSIAVSYIKADSGGEQFEIAEDILYSISGNNMDGYIIAEWR